MNRTPPPRGEVPFDDALLGAALGAALVLAALARSVDHHLATLAGVLALVALTGWLALWLRAGILDRLAARSDPAAPGVIVGTVRGSWLLAGRRPFRLPWTAFPQHVLIDGPTGRGKTFTFIRPLLRAHIARPATGVFYLDGKGDPVHVPNVQSGEPPVAFDHVFNPEDPEASACWNPLAGPDPAQAASLFAAALFPEAAQTSATFYEARAVYVITRVATAIALTGHDPAATPPVDEEPEPDEATPASDEATIVRRLVAAGVSKKESAVLARTRAALCERQLDLLADSPQTTPARLVELIKRDDADPPSDPPAGADVAARDVTPAALSNVIFEADGLAKLHDALGKSRDASATDSHEHAALTQLHRDIGALMALPARERAATLANLQNRLGHFLQPPFLELCSRADFQVADVTRGAHLAVLLSAGAFPTAGPILGRVALAQFKHAVLASRPGIAKIAVLDEFHNFVSSDFAAFLAQARSKDGGAIIALQTLAALNPEDRDALLANVSTVILTPGCKPFDASYWSEAFGQHQRARSSYSYLPASPFSPAPKPSVRIDWRDEPRYTPTRITELDPGHALIQVTAGRRSYPAVVVDVERRA